MSNPGRITKLAAAMKPAARALIAALCAACVHAAPDAPARLDRLYSSWHQECAAIAFSSNTRDYIALPSYRKIVAMGESAVPFLERKLREDAAGDFRLASAVAEIRGWPRSAFSGESEQAFRDRVLRKLAASADFASWSAYKDGREVLRFQKGPGKLTSRALPGPGAAASHPWLNAQSLDANEEDGLRRILESSSGFDDFTARLKAAGYDVRPEGARSN